MQVNYMLLWIIYTCLNHINYRPRNARVIDENAVVPFSGHGVAFLVYVKPRDGVG